MKRRTVIAIVLSFAILLGFIYLPTLFSNDVTSDEISETEIENMQSEGNNSSDEVTDSTNDDSSQLPSTSAENPDQTSTIEEPTPKYYVNDNYFIKPLNPEDSNKVVLLTFDDAPQGDYTLEILDTLDKYDAKALFFVNGHYAVKNKELIEEIYNRGHIIGNHTWWHENLKSLDSETTREEIVSVNDLIEEITGERPQYFRPPFGVMSDTAKGIIAEENMQSMNWSLGSLDWEYVKPEQSPLVRDQVLNNVIPGSNILMHDKEVTALALDEMLKTLKDQGYEFVLPTEVSIPN